MGSPEVKGNLKRRSRPTEVVDTGLEGGTLCDEKKALGRTSSSRFGSESSFPFLAEAREQGKKVVLALGRRHLFKLVLATLCVLSVLLRFQTGGNPWVPFKTQVVTSVPFDLMRAFWFRWVVSSHETVHQIPSKQAVRLLLDPRLHGRKTEKQFREQRHMLFPSFDTCANYPLSKNSSRSIGSNEWINWIHTSGTANARFQMAVLPDSTEEQEFPIFESPSPCGIYQASTAWVGVSNHKVVASAVKGKGNGTVLVIRMDKECNLGHTLREGVLLCVYLLKRQLNLRKTPLPFSLYIFFSKDGAGRLAKQEQDYKIEFMRAFGNVKFFDQTKVGENVVSYFEQVYEAPWNHIAEGTFRGMLAGGWLQGVFGDDSLKLAMSRVIVNRKALRMYTGFSKAVRNGLKVPVRSPTNGGVVFIQRGIYANGNPDHERHEKSKQRVLVDSESGTKEGLLHHLCSTGLPIREVDFHPSAKVNKLWDQIAIMAQAAVLVSVHGSGMWNAVWMLPGSIAIEVLLRPGHCCFPIPKRYTGFGNKNICKSPCSVYTMINIADGIMASGVRWMYYDPKIIDQPSGETNRETSRVHVDGSELAKIVSGAHAMATQ